MIDTVDSGAPVADVVNNVELPPQDDGIVYEGNKPLSKESEPEAKTEPEGEPDGSEEAPKKENGWKRQRTRLKEENQRLQAELAKFQGQSAQAQPVESTEPKETDFENVLDYLKAQAEWTADKKLSDYQQKQAQEAEERQFAERLSALEEREEAFSEQYPDYHEKVEALLNTGIVTQDVVKAVVASDISEKIAYHLTQFPQDAYLMAQMGNNKQALKQAIAQIEDFIEAQPKTAVKQTKAAAPITPVATKSANSSKSPADMSVQELEAWRYGYRK